MTVVGTSGSGKTTMAARLASAFGLEHVELDALYWQPNWTETPVEEFRQKVSEALQAEGWVTDGNYGKVSDIVLSRAETLVWLDYPLRVVLNRVTKRTARRIVVRQQLWSGNREDLRAFFRWDNVILWAARTHRRRRREYGRLLQEKPYPHLHVIRLRSPREADAWLAHVTRDLSVGA